MIRHHKGDFAHAESKTAIPTSPVGAVGVMADIIKLGDLSCYLGELVKKKDHHSLEKVLQCRMNNLAANIIPRLQDQHFG